jgi:hypothetical protein
MIGRLGPVKLNNFFVTAPTMESKKERTTPRRIKES